MLSAPLYARMLRRKCELCWCVPFRRLRSGSGGAPNGASLTLPWLQHRLNRSAPGAELFHGSPRDPIWDYVLSEEAADRSFAARQFFTRGKH